MKTRVYQKSDALESYKSRGTLENEDIRETSAKGSAVSRRKKMRDEALVRSRGRKRRSDGGVHSQLIKVRGLQ